jgi:glutathione S-transferase
MKKFIAAAAFVVAKWQPADAQAILGSIPEEFRGDWSWQENTDLRARRVQAQGWFIEHRSHAPRHGPPILRFRQWDGERRHPQDGFPRISRTALRLDRQAAGRQTIPDGRQVHCRRCLSVHGAALVAARRYRSEHWPNITAYLDRVAARPKVREAMKAEGLVQ